MGGGKGLPGAWGMREQLQKGAAAKPGEGPARNEKYPFAVV